MKMQNLKYSLVIEATPDPRYFAFYSPDLEGFSGSGKSVDDCLRRAEVGVAEHLQLLQEQGLPIPLAPTVPEVIIVNNDQVLPAA